MIRCRIGWCAATDCPSELQDLKDVVFASVPRIGETVKLRGFFSIVRDVWWSENGVVEVRLR